MHQGCSQTANTARARCLARPRASAFLRHQEALRRPKCSTPRLHGGNGLSVRARMRLGPHARARPGRLVSRPTRGAPTGYARPQGRLYRAASAHATSGHSLVLHLGGRATRLLHLARALPADTRRFTAARAARRPAARQRAGAPRSSSAAGSRPCRDQGRFGRPTSPRQASWPRLAVAQVPPWAPAVLVRRACSPHRCAGRFGAPYGARGGKSSGGASTSSSVSPGAVASRAGCWLSGTGALPLARVLTLPCPDPPRAQTLPGH